MFPAVFFSRLMFRAHCVTTKTSSVLFATFGLVLLATGCADGSGSDSGGSVNNQSQSPGTALRSSSFESSTLCPSGGVLLELGFDKNKNDILDDDEVQTTQEVCHGTNGTDGSNGTDGENGNSGLNALVAVTEEAIGSENCAFGGLKIESGLDANANNVLEPGEVNATQTQFVCNGENGEDGENTGEPSASSLVETTFEPSGGNCAYGGIRIDNGIDENRDGTLQETEKASPVYVCNGADATGTPGTSSLVKLTIEASGGNCEYGGTRIESGLDANDDGILDAGEVTQSQFVCEPQSCSWTDNSDGTTTISCDGEEDRVVLNPDALGFTSRTSCGVAIDHPEGGGATIPLIYTIDAIGNDLKFITLSVLDGDVQISNSRLLTSTANNPLEFERSVISVYFDTFEEATGGRYQALLNEGLNQMTLVYFDEDELPGDGYVGSVFQAFVDDDGPGVCNRVLSVAD